MALPLEIGRGILSSVARGLRAVNEMGCSVAVTSEPEGVTRARLEALAKAQGIVPVEDPSTLLGTFWPEDESIDEFLAALEAWHREDELPPTQ